MDKKVIGSIFASVFCLLGLLVLFGGGDEKVTVVEAKAETVYSAVEQQGIDYQKKLAKNEQA